MTGGKSCADAHPTLTCPAGQCLRCGLCGVLYDHLNCYAASISEKATEHQRDRVERAFDETFGTGDRGEDVVFHNGALLLSRCYACGHRLTEVGSMSDACPECGIVFSPHADYAPETYPSICECSSCV